MTVKVISDDEFKKAEDRINSEMEKFDHEHRIYMQQSREAARHVRMG